MAAGVLEALVTGFFKILLGGTAAFMLLAIGQEWNFFQAAWFGENEVAPGLSETDRRGAADTVHDVLTLMSHLYASGGDTRFSERMPASSAMIAEMTRDIQYLAGNHRVEEPSLQRLEVTAVETLGGGRVEVHTREFWTIRHLWSRRGREADPIRAYVSRQRYRLSPTATGWRVDSWEWAPPEDAARPSSLPE